MRKKQKKKIHTSRKGKTSCIYNSIKRQSLRTSCPALIKNFNQKQTTKRKKLINHSVKMQKKNLHWYTSGVCQPRKSKLRPKLFLSSVGCVYVYIWFILTFASYTDIYIYIQQAKAMCKLSHSEQ